MMCLIVSFPGHNSCCLKYNFGSQAREAGNEALCTSSFLAFVLHVFVAPLNWVDCTEGEGGMGREEKGKEREHCENTWATLTTFLYRLSQLQQCDQGMLPNRFS